jgi:two-component system response regulator YesN
MEPLTLSELAARLNYSLPYVSKKFKEDLGVSFVSYLQNYRVMQGCRLLSSSRYSLGEITEMVGYHDSKFFSTLIKRMTGLSPADFRRKHRV